MKDIDKERETIIVFAPHPDDETIGCGGTIAKSLAAEYEVVVVVLTPGEKLFSVVLDIHADPSPEEVGQLRRDETRRATEILGVKKENLLFWDYKDGELEQEQDDLLEKIVRLLRDRAPVAVYFHNAYEEHKDHRAANSIVRRACARLQTKIIKRQFIVSLKSGLSPSDLDEKFERVDVSEYLPLKARALAQFQSHLGILSERQQAPLVPNFDNYLTTEELFIIDD